jgi:large subunit ribosomal protein L5
MSKANLKKHYQEVVVPKLMQDRQYKNVMQVPAIKKITLNMGLGAAAIADKKVVTNALEELSLIAGQRAVVTKSRKSIAGFKLREGWPIGCKVTLRKERMYHFLERLLSVAIPRIRDFRGLNRHSFDKQGNYSMGILEQIVFPEIKYDKIDALRGLDITITTTARNKEEGLALLQAFNFPLRET